MGAGAPLPTCGLVFVSVNDNDKDSVIPIARGLSQCGFQLMATGGTADRLKTEGMEVEKIFKVNEGRPNVVDRIKNGEIDLIINTPLGRESYLDEQTLRRSAYAYNVPIITTLSGAAASVAGIRSLQAEELEVTTLQEYHGN